jgi:disulfide bond formation protein DsbB
MRSLATKQTQRQNVKFVPFFQQYGAYLALIPALTAMLGSLYYSEVAGFIPCTLCWYQRILMYPLSLIILIGILKRDEFLPSYVLPFSMLGIGFSSYHYLIQLGVIAHSAACSSGVPCSGRYVNYLGFITIPLMALTAFILITVIMAATRWADNQETAT